jgi:hypothetical protein
MEPGAASRIGGNVRPIPSPPKPPVFDRTKLGRSFLARAAPDFFQLSPIERRSRPIVVRWVRAAGKTLKGVSETKVIARVCVYSSITAIALISIKYSGDVILQTSTMVEAGAGALKYSRRTLWI